MFSNIKLDMIYSGTNLLRFDMLLCKTNFHFVSLPDRFRLTLIKMRRARKIV